MIISVYQGMDEQEVLEKVTKKILDNSQCGLDILVRLVGRYQISIEVDVTGISAGTAYDAVSKYISSVGIGGTVYVSQISSAIMSEGALDVKVIEPTENVTVPSDSTLNATITINEVG